MIQSECELIKRKKFSPCKKEEWEYEKQEYGKSIQKVIEERIPMVINILWFVSQGHDPRVQISHWNNERGKINNIKRDLDKIILNWKQRETQTDILIWLYVVICIILLGFYLREIVCEKPLLVRADRWQQIKLRQTRWACNTHKHEQRQCRHAQNAHTGRSLSCIVYLL